MNCLTTQPRCFSSSIDLIRSLLKPINQLSNNSVRLYGLPITCVAGLTWLRRLRTKDGKDTTWGPAVEIGTEVSNYDLRQKMVSAVRHM